MLQKTDTKILPGMHTTVKNSYTQILTESESKILTMFSNEWYISKISKLKIGTSDYKYFFIKPTDHYIEAFNFNREIICVFSSYKNFEPRTLETFEKIHTLFSEMRLEKICYVLLSADNNLNNILSTLSFEKESQIIIPFIYSETLSNKTNSHYIRNQFRAHFYSRDLFDFSSPLKKDTFFFGRNQLINSLVNKHLTHENSGLFGLRKTGKTSIIYGILRTLNLKEELGVLIDCESPSINNVRWYKALYHVILRIAEETQIILDDFSSDKFTSESATDFFEFYLQQIYTSTGKSIMLLFDEIENITYGKSPTSFWCSELDSVYFWQAIRSVYHKLDRVFTFSLFGTNPKCVELVSIEGKDNPIFNIFKPQYIPGFDVHQTRDMVRKLGRLMGMNFDETIYSKLTEDYGGHPFLIRRLCSTAANIYSTTRPVTIDRIKYENVKKKFDSCNANYYEMLLVVLEQFYSDEYEMLKMLACGDIETFKFYANQDPYYINHLKGYGVISEVDGEYDFKIDSVKNYILQKNKKIPLALTIEEKWSEICVARCNLEKELRVFVKKMLKVIYKNEANAKEHIVKKIYSNDKKHLAYSYNDLFDPKKSNIYFKDLKTLINTDWDYFNDYFVISQEEFINNMDILNKEGRFDTHAKDIGDDDVLLFRAALNKIKVGVDKFNA